MKFLLYDVICNIRFSAITDGELANHVHWEPINKPRTTQKFSWVENSDGGYKRAFRNIEVGGEDRQAGDSNWNRESDCRYNHHSDGARQFLVEL
jgi:hypothetical protein